MSSLWLLKLLALFEKMQPLALLLFFCLCVLAVDGAKQSMFRRVDFKEPKPTHQTRTTVVTFPDGNRRIKVVMPQTTRAEPGMKTTSPAPFEANTTLGRAPTTTSAPLPTFFLPINVSLALSRLHSFDDFLKNLVYNPQQPKTSAIRAPVKVLRAGNGINDNFEGEPLPAKEGRTIAPFASPATCSPQPTTIPIAVSGNPYDIYFPSCTRLDRCGGCCSHELLECAPSKVENLQFQVMKTQYLGPPINKFASGEVITISLDQHLECQCECRVKEKDCRAGLQVYKANECRCECLNSMEASSCFGDKIWDPTNCSCRCREYLECSTGYNFNTMTCSCELNRVKRMG